ncbi:MAG: hypothetical protein OES21_01075 [Myxococcales bacterium]|nr:hypothetical protein [Myxococcales bacterium]
MSGSYARPRHMLVLGAILGVLSLLVVSSSTRAEPSALDEAAPSKKEKPDTDKPKEEKAVTVPAGTVMMVKTGEKVSSSDKAGRNFSATLEANLLAGDDVVAKAGTQVYGQVVGSKKVGRGIVVQHSGHREEVNIPSNVPNSTGHPTPESRGSGFYVDVLRAVLVETTTPNPECGPGVAVAA